VPNVPSVFGSAALAIVARRWVCAACKASHFAECKEVFSWDERVEI